MPVELLDKEMSGKMRKKKKKEMEVSKVRPKKKKEKKKRKKISCTSTQFYIEAFLVSNVGYFLLQI
jgi:hypothetical protein